MDPNRLKQVLTNHAAWLSDASEGKKANLQGADLREANLRGAYLQGADLKRADLQGLDLREANLRGVKLDKYVITKDEYYTYLNGAYWFYKNQVDLTRLDGPLLELARLHR